MSLESWNKDNFDDFHPQKETIFSDVPADRTAVDNILRLNYTNQLRLTLMADTKANIMITVSSIVFSICLANITNPTLTIPLSILGMILAQLRLYTQILSFFETSSSLAALSKDIGKHEFVLKKTVPDVKRHYSINDLKKLYQLCCDADFKIKRGQIKPFTAIQELVMHF